MMPWRSSWHALRWVVRTASPALSVHVLPRWLVLALAVVQADAVVNWEMLSAELRAQSPLTAGIALGGLVGLNAWGEARAARQALFGSPFVVLRRQPLPGAALGPAVAWPLLLLAVPVTGLGVIWHGMHNPVAAGWWTLLALPAGLLAGARRPLATVAATAGAAGLAAWGQAFPAAIPALAGFGTLLLIPALGVWAMHPWCAEHGRAPRPTSVRARSSVPLPAVLAHRDVRALWRGAPGRLWTGWALAPIVGTVVYLFRVNGRANAMELTRVSVVALAALGPWVLATLAALARIVPLDVRRWPVSALQRTQGFMLLGGVLLAPSCAAAAIGGAPVMTFDAHLRVMAYAVAALGGAIALVSWRPHRRSWPHAGWFPWWLGVCLIPAVMRGWGMLALGDRSGGGRDVRGRRDGPAGATAPMNAPSLRAKQLTYRFPNGFTAGPLDLEVGPGLHHLTGPNGSGKTTLMRCLCADLRRASGVVQVCGRDPRAEVEGRRSVAWLPAEPDLPGMLTVDEAWQELAAIPGRLDMVGGRAARPLPTPRRPTPGPRKRGPTTSGRIRGGMRGGPARAVAGRAVRQPRPRPRVAGGGTTR